MMNRNAAGHLSALLTIVIWGTTFISTKIFLTDFQPVEILFFRFVLGSAGAAGHVRLGLLFRADQEDQRIWLQHYPDD